MIINLRGTSGSGKTTVARGFLDMGGFEEVDLVPYKTDSGTPRMVTGLKSKKLKLVIVGKYKTACGGCDGIKTQDLICESVRKAAKLADNVFFEGLLISGLFSRYLSLSKEKLSDPFVWTFLDTPIDTCLARIQKRNGGKPIKEDNTISKHHAVESVIRKATEAGEVVKIVKHKKAFDQVYTILKEGI